MARGKRTSKTSGKSAAKALRGSGSGRTKSAAASLLVARSSSGRWLVKREGAKRASSTHATRDEALAAATQLAGETAVVVAESAPTATERLLDVIGIEVDAGARTTLRVPPNLDDTARAIADEIGTSRNDALIRLALAGARVVERAREAEEKRQARRASVVEADGALAGDSFPSLDEMREAALALRTAR